MSKSADVYYPQTPSAPSVYPTLPGQQPEHEQESLLNPRDPESQRHERGHTRCWHAVDDWDQPEHDHLNSKANWAIVLSIIGLFFIWPISIVSLCLISDIRKDIIRGYRKRHRHWCKVNTAYWLSVFTIIFGVIEWALFGYGMWSQFHHH